ncbi:CC0125/CC1285 family lipoprotein [Caulobacter mirabilis]|uniref:Lipoprotein transmembrane n=1 Tax=Caulobacter mirabilis TaxID=69666 RepID=A0A2D2B384_9CAUL|nr:hypothetical protein [Caulobacter mirabilis]ATQ44697.1 hypothetical protein CSW64_21055 [Caulobacter mirabilis]
MTLRARTLAVMLAAATALSACATATPYQPNIPGQQVSGGFSEDRIEQNRFRISFAGNTLTSRDTVERYLLYRAAELTVGEGYDWFTLVDRATDRKSRTYVDPGPAYGPYGYGYWRPYWRYYGPSWGWRAWDPWYGDPFWADRMDVRTVEKFEATAEVVLGKGPKPTDDPRAFNAREVMANLGPGIQRPASH